MRLARSSRTVPLLAVLLPAVLLVLQACGDPVDGEATRRGGIPLDPGYVKDEVVSEAGVHRRTILTHSYLLHANLVAQMPEPFLVRPFDLKERVWITAWASNTEDPDGRREPDDIHCHSSLSDKAIQAGQDMFVGVCTDGFTPRFVLPEGFGIAVDPGDSYFFRPMFNNRRPDPRLARMRVVIDYLTDAEAGGRLTALRGFAVSATRPDLYYVMPNQDDTKSRAFPMPFSGRIHAIGAHLHPYGRSVELRRDSDRKVMFTARMTQAEDLGDWRLSTYVSKEGFYVAKDEPFQVTAVYVNDSEKRADAMAGFFIFYDPEGKPDK